MNIVIIGGGISGISAAKVALGEKHDVTILEFTPEPGGLVLNMMLSLISGKANSPLILTR